ncbi:MAG TPA: PH domain-containing protein [Actinomycetota bacterium]|nr:PH domain-containing protein [Actinomycetota bacterium]
MPYPRKLLNPGEQIAFDLHPHWWYFAPVATLAVAIVAAAVVVTVTLKDATQTYTLLGVAVFAAIWLVAFLVKFAEWRTTQFVLTSDRLIVRSGVLSKEGREIPLERINDLSYHQSFFERLVGAGDLVIESAGERGQDRFSRIPHPAHAQQLIYTEMENNRQRVSSVHAEPQASSIPDQIAELAKLRDQGVVTDAEFQAKKTELLSRM